MRSGQPTLPIPRTPKSSSTTRHALDNLHHLQQIASGVWIRLAGFVSTGRATDVPPPTIHTFAHGPKRIDSARRRDCRPTNRPHQLGTRCDGPDPPQSDRSANHARRRANRGQEARSGLPKRYRTNRNPVPPTRCVASDPTGEVPRLCTGDCGRQGATHR